MTDAPPPPAEWPALVDALQGTCGDLPAEHEGLWNNRAFCDMVDGQIFRCEVCEWWCELSEMGSDGQSQGVCYECCRDNDIPTDQD